MTAFHNMHERKGVGGGAVLTCGKTEAQNDKLEPVFEAPNPSSPVDSTLQELP